MATINLYLYNPHQASASYPFSIIDASFNADADIGADAQCGQGLMKQMSSSLISQIEFFMTLHYILLDIRPC